LNVTAGFRLIDNAAFGLHFTPKLSAMLSLGDFRLRAGWSQGFKSPTTKELSYHYTKQMGASTYYYMGNKDLEAQTSNYWSASAEYRTDDIAVSVTGYVNKLEDMITLVNVSVKEIPVGATSSYEGDGSSNIIPRMYKNAEDAKTYGVDVNASWKITKELTIGGNYSYLDTKATVYNSAKGHFQNAIIDGMAHNKWNGYANYGHRFSPCYNLGVNLSTRGSSKRYYENDGNGKAFQIWRLNTTHDLGKSKTTSYRLEVGVDNIFNYRDTTPRPYHLGTTTGGTTVYASFTIKFNKGKKITTSKTTSKQQENDED
jgi:outer membrane receptor for ferrienterochelin and colicins